MLSCFALTKMTQEIIKIETVYLFSITLMRYRNAYRLEINNIFD